MRQEPDRLGVEKERAEEDPGERPISQASESRQVTQFSSHDTTVTEQEGETRCS